MDFMKYFFFGIIILLHSTLFADDNIENYMKINGMNYPYNIGSNINDSHFIDYSIETIYDSVDAHELTNEQRNIIVPFFELKSIPNVISFSIDKIHLVRYSSEQKYIHVYIIFFADQKPSGFSRYNNEFNFWQYFNIAIYSINEYEYLGFHFE